MKKQTRIIKLLSIQKEGLFEQQKRVYSTNGISPTLSEGMGRGGGTVPMFLVVRRFSKGKEQSLAGK